MPVAGRGGGVMKEEARTEGRSGGQQGGVAEFAQRVEVFFNNSGARATRAWCPPSRSAAWS
jgi:hypothetical protein